MDWGAEQIAGRRAIIVTVGFAAVLVAVGNLAWATAVTTTRPWFSPALSSQNYVVTLIASTILAIGVTLVASIHVSSIGRSIADLDQRIAVLRGSPRSDDGTVSPATWASDQDIEDELDEILGALERNVALVEVTRSPDPTASSRVPRTNAAEEVRSVVRALVTERSTLRRGVSFVRNTVAGPIAAAIVFGAIASTMLPGVQGFAEANFQLNTAFLLFLAYGWPFLVAWAIAAMALSRHIPSP